MTGPGRAAGGALPVGRRVAYWRTRRKLTQQQFADLIGKSKSWVDKVERGIRRLDKVSVLHDVADALRLDVASLVGPAEAARPRATGPARSAVAEVRAALTRYEPHAAPATDPRPVPALPELRGAVDHAWLSLQYAAYDRLLRTLPAVLADARRAWTTERDGPTAGLLSEVYQVTASVLRKLGDLHTAWLAADRAMMLGADSGRPLLAARAAVPLGGVVRELGQPREAMRACLGFADQLAPPAPLDAGPEHLSVYGCLLLQAAMSAAQLGDRDRVGELVDRAAGVAARVGGGRNDCWTAFGAALVEVVQVAAAVEVGDADLAIAGHRRVTAHPGYARLPVAVRADHLIDAARGYLLLGDVLSAGRSLVRADRLAPAEVRTRPAARDVLSLVLRRSVRPDPLVAEIGQRIGIDGAR